MEVAQLLAWSRSWQGFGEEEKADFSKNLLRYSRNSFFHSLSGAIMSKALNANSKSPYNPISLPWADGVITILMQKFCFHFLPCSVSHWFQPRKHSCLYSCLQGWNQVLPTSGRHNVKGPLIIPGHQIPSFLIAVCIFLISEFLVHCAVPRRQWCLINLVNE